GPDVEVSVPWEMTRAAGRGRGAPGPVSGGPGAPAPQAPPPAPSGDRLGSQCGQPQMQALAGPQGNKIVYAKALEGAECFQTSFTGFGADAKDNDIRIENKRTGAGVRVTSDR